MALTTMVALALMNRQRWQSRAAPSRRRSSSGLREMAAVTAARDEGDEGGLLGSIQPADDGRPGSPPPRRGVRGVGGGLVG